MKYHDTDEGPKECRAKTIETCKAKKLKDGSDPKHYDNKRDAEDAWEAKLAKEGNAGHSDKLKKPARRPRVQSKTLLTGISEKELAKSFHGYNPKNVNETAPKTYFDPKASMRRVHLPNSENVDIEEFKSSAAAIDKALNENRTAGNNYRTSDGGTRHYLIIQTADHHYSGVPKISKTLNDGKYHLEFDHYGTWTNYGDYDNVEEALVKATNKFGFNGDEEYDPEVDY